jgi:hypothetical protein
MNAKQSAQHRTPLKQGVNLSRDSVSGCGGINPWQTVLFVRQSTPEPDDSRLVLCNHAFPPYVFR